MTIEEIRKRIEPNSIKLKRYLIKSTSNELTNLSKTCYYPKVHRYYYELLSLCNISEKELKDFVKETYYDTKARTFLLINESYTNLILIICNFFLNEKIYDAAHAAMIFIHIRFYSSLMNINIKYCNSSVFSYTLDNMQKTHLFIREKSIANALMFLSQEMTKKHMKSISNWDNEDLIRMIQESRHRVSQSVKSFASSYYDSAKNKMGYKLTPEYEEEEGGFQAIPSERGKKLIDDIVKDITIYKQIDNKALDDSRKITKISIITSNQITKNICNTKFSDIIRTCLQLFIKSLDNTSQLCKIEYFNNIRKLMSIKRSSKTIYFKQQIIILTEQVCKEFDYSKTYQGLSSQSKLMLHLFVALYITMYVRNKIC